MKKITLTLLLILATVWTLSAQTSYSCHYREYCDWDEEEGEFVDCSGYDEPSLFVMNSDKTMFTHTIESMKSTYYVKKKEYSEENDVWTYEVISDVGNEYYYVYDDKNKEIRVLYEKDGQTRLIRFYVKAIF